MLIVNGKLITWETENRILEGQAVYIEGKDIKELGPEAELKAKYPEAEVVDAGGQLVMPGNICAHTHFYGAYARGMAIPGTAPKDFPEILQKLWWPLDKALDEASVRGFGAGPPGGCDQTWHHDLDRPSCFAEFYYQFAGCDCRGGGCLRAAGGAVL